MTRPTIDFGIDLGTTNSAVAVREDGRPHVIANMEGERITPSAVMIERNGGLTVGKRAYEAGDKRPEAVAREFKRAMGTEQTFSLSGKEMTPEALSAEVLKALKADVQAIYADDLRSAVVTVPAMFAHSACEATSRAARMAGIEQCVLLQEPIAAGLAYGFNEEQSHGYWLVYDLGGGTFDTSLLTMRDGRLEVVDHAGDEGLGGKDFDNLLVDYVVSELNKDYSIAAPLRGGGASAPRRLLYAILKRACEEAKIRLSRQSTASVELANVFDDRGHPIDIYVDVPSSKYLELIEPLVTRTIRIASNLLSRNNLEPSRVHRVIMVGGPTLTPFIRERVQEDLGIEPAVGIDPMTVVAQGAALFAGSVWREGLPATRLADAPSGLIVNLKYEPVSEQTEVLVGGRLEGVTRSQLVLQIERSDGGWSSGRLPITNSTFVAEVILARRSLSTFRLRVFDGTGTELPIEPNEFAITNGLVVDEPPLSKSLGVAVVGAADEPYTRVLLSRGTHLPATAKGRFETVHALVPGQRPGINIHVVEGEAPRADRNDHVGYIRLDGTNVTRPLPPGTQVDITIKVDTSRRLSVEAFVPLLDETYELTVENVDRPIPRVEVLEQLLEAEQERLQRIGAVASVGEASGQIGDVQRAIDEARVGDLESAARAQRLLRQIQAELDRVQNAADLPLLQAEWRDLLPRTRDLLSEYGEPAQRQQLLALEGEGEASAQSGDQTLLRHHFEQLRDLYWSVLMAQTGWWIGLYQDLSEHQEQMTDPATARVLFQEGRRALDRQDFDSLRRACSRLWELLPQNGRGQMTHGLPDVGVRG